MTTVSDPSPKEERPMKDETLYSRLQALRDVVGDLDPSVDDIAERIDEMLTEYESASPHQNNTASEETPSQPDTTRAKAQE